MSSRPFDELPNEVLLHVFVKGAEDEPDEKYYSSCFRRLKIFPHLARQVCARWKTIIDNPPSNVSFWIASLVLRPGGLNERMEAAFAKQIATFRHQLLSSNGCDLAILFSLLYPSQEMAMDILSPYASAIIRLVIHAMDLITPYRNRVIRLDLRNTPLAIHLHLLRLIATCWTGVLRLVSVNCWEASSTTVRMSLSSLPGYDRILPEISNRAPPQISFDRLRNLDNLMIPASFCIGEEFFLPPNIQSLKLSVSRDGLLPKLFNFLQTQKNSLESLRSVGMYKVTFPEVIPAEQSDKREQAKRSTKQSLNCLIMPLLRTLSLNGILAQEAWDFLTLLRCRCLENLSLDLIGEEELDKNTLFLLDSPSKFPKLTIVNMKQTLQSWQSLYYLELFTNLPIQTLAVTFEEYELDWVDHLDAFRTSLSKLRLQDLNLFGPYWVIHDLLVSMDTQILTKLNASDWSRDPIEPFVMAKEIAAPHLRTLTFGGTEDHLVRILSQLEAIQLDIVEANVIGDEHSLEGWDREKALQTLAAKSFPMVRVANLTFSGADRPLLHLFPNLRELKLWISVEKSSTDDNDVTLSLISTVIQSLCDTLTPTSPAAPVPHLHSIRADCSVLGYGNKQFTQWSDNTKEKVRSMTQEVLASRAKAGAQNLQMEPLQFGLSSSGLGLRKATVTLEAYAAG